MSELPDNIAMIVTDGQRTLVLKKVPKRWKNSRLYTEEHITNLADAVKEFMCQSRLTTGK
jgi:hypothetical protein